MANEHLKEIFEEEIRQELASSKPTLEEFKQMVYEDRARKKLKNRIKKLFKR